MLSIHRILVPVVFADTSRHVVHQAAWLARRLHAEIILLHVVTPLNYPAGLLERGHEITARDLHAHIVQRAQSDLDQVLQPELDGIAVTRVLLRGDPAREIAKMARDRNVDLIMMSTHGYGAFYRFLLGSVTAKVLHETQCPVWTGAHLEEEPAREFSMRHVLSSVELNGHSGHTVSLAAEPSESLVSKDVAQTPSQTRFTVNAARTSVAAGARSGLVTSMLAAIRPTKGVEDRHDRDLPGRPRGREIRSLGS